MIKFILSFVVCWAVAVPVFCQTYLELSERALKAAEKDSLAQAEEYILQALSLEPANPHNALLFSNLGTIQRRRHNYEKALESYTYALNFAPRTVPVLLNRAALYLELGKDELARIDYALVLDIDTSNQEALLMRTYIYMRKHDYKAARSDYDRLLRLDPRSYNGRLGLATLEQKEGNYEEALALLNNMITDKSDGTTQITPSQLAVLHVARAGVERDMHHMDLALIDLEEAVNLDASQADAFLLRGQIYLSQKKKDLAKKDFEKAVSLGIPLADVRELLAQCK